jgi:formate-nitrite transporter family protein
MVTKTGKQNMSEEIVRLKSPVADQDHVAGPASATITLVEYGNFECIQCGNAYRSLKQIRKVSADGLRLVFRNFPTVQTHPCSLRAAEAAEAAAAQGKFWQMHDELFRHQKALEDHDLIRYAKRVSLDIERFKHDLADNVFPPKIRSAYEQSLFDEHVTGTPTIYLNETRYTGATDVQSLLGAIKQTDPEGRIQLSERAGQMRHFLRKLRHGSGALADIGQTVID